MVTREWDLTLADLLFFALLWFPFSFGGYVLTVSGRWTRNYFGCSVTRMSLLQQSLLPMANFYDY